LQGGKQTDELTQVTPICNLKGIDVSFSMITGDNEREPTVFDEDEGGDTSGDATVSVLEGVDLRESMVKPSGFDFWGHMLGVVSMV
jgi:hypothetical protein